MKIKIFSLFLIFLTFSAKSADQDKFEKMCSNVQMLSGIASQLTVVPWQTIVMTPSGPILTVTLAMISDRGGLTEFCTVYHTLKYAEGADRVFGGLQQLDRMMEGKHNNKITLTRDLFDNAVAIRKASKMQGDTLDKMHRIAGRVNRSLKDINGLITEIDGEDPMLFITRQQQESSMRRQIEMAKNITLITSQIRCENNKPTKENNDPKFVSDSQIKQEELGYVESDIDFLVMTLQRMAIKFTNSNEDFNNFKKELGFLTKETVKYHVSNEKRTIVGSEMVAKKGKLEPHESTHIKREKKILQDYQVFKGVNDLNIQAEFLKKFQPRWDGYVETKSFETLNKTLVRKLGGQAEEEFYDNAYECRSSLIYRRAKETNPSYFMALNDGRRSKAMAEQREICRNELKNIDRRVSLFKRYTEELVQAIIKQRGLQGDLWTIDSYYNGTIRVERNGELEGSENHAMEDLGCKDKRTAGEQKQMKFETTKQIGDLRQTLLEEKMKQNEMEQQKIIAEKKMKEDIELKRSIDLEISSKNSLKENARIPSIVEPGGL